MKAPTTAPFPPFIIDKLRPRPRLTPARWAIEVPYQIAETGAVQPGPYNLPLTPFWREPLDAMGDPTVRWLNIVASSQLGKTLTVIVGMLWRLRHRPGNWLYVRNALPDLTEAFRDRFEPSIRANLREMIPPHGSWMTVSDNPAITLLGGIIYGAAATITRQMTSRTTPGIWFDECDSGGEISNDLGNILELLDERQMAAPAGASLTVGSSTPMYEEGSNWQAYDRRSDRREYWEPCPLCGHYQPLTTRRITVPDGQRDPMAIRATQCAWYECESCKGPIPQDRQGWMSDRGIWVPAHLTVAEPLPLNDAAIVETSSLTINAAESRWEPRMAQAPGSAIPLDAPPSPHRGYRAWRAMAKFDQCTWSNILAKFMESRADPEKLQVFTNSWEGLPWKDAIGPADEEMIKARMCALPSGIVPTRARVILGGVDIQADSIWYGFRAFGAGGESWNIETGTMEVHAQNYQATLDTLYARAFTRGWPVHGEHPETGLRMRTYALDIDSGYLPDEAYRFADRPGVIASKGEDTAIYRVRKTVVERKNRPDPVELYLINVLVFKNRLQRLIRVKAGEPQEWHLPADTTDEYISHLTAEELRLPKKTSRAKIWLKKAGRRDNHLLDVEVMILALCEALEQRGELSIMALRDTDPAMGLFRLGGGAGPSAGRPMPVLPPKPAPIRGRVPGFSWRGGIPGR